MGLAPCVASGTAACWFAVVSLVFAAAASADGPVGARGADDYRVTSDDPSGTDALDDQDPAGELPATPPVPPTGAAVPVWWPWLELEPGHDKCKRRKAWALPLWCFGSSSWPVLKAHAVTATVKGIHDGKSAGGSRR